MCQSGANHFSSVFFVVVLYMNHVKLWLGSPFFNILKLSDLQWICGKISKKYICNVISHLFLSENLFLVIVSFIQSSSGNMPIEFKKFQSFPHR